MRVVVMQPYFYPYAGYFRLFAACDLFVILDDCQFNRRSYVHRYKKANGWETLPIKKTSRDFTRIMDLEWREPREPKPVDYIIGTMKEVCEKLQLPFNTVRSSELNVSPNLRSQARIIAICERVGATDYINSPGGRALYDETTFMEHGIKLRFLNDYKGNYASIIERLATESPSAIREEIVSQI